MKDRLAADLDSLRIDRSPGPPRRWTRTAVSVLGACAVLVLVSWLVLPKIKARLFKTEVSVTEIVAVRSAQASVELTATGYIVPQTVAKVGAKVPGRIAKANVTQGQVVRAGDVLFELDGVDQRSAAAAARARVEVTKARVLVARANALETRIQLDRQRQLLASGATTQAQVDDLSARSVSLDEAIKAAEADVHAAQADVQIAMTGVANLVVSAPIDGIAISRPAQLGDLVGATQFTSQVLVEIADPRSIRVEVDVPETRMAAVRINGSCDVVLDAFPSARLRGIVREIGPILNRAKATATVKVEVVNNPMQLRPDMSARVSFLDRELTDAELTAPSKVIVPASAIVDRSGNKLVYAIRDGRVDEMAVTVGDQVGAGWELKSGPPAGTRVVSNPPASLKGGMAISERAQR